MNPRNTNDRASDNAAAARLRRRLQEGALLARRVEGDRLVLADATLLAALDGSRPLTAGERVALEASPLTARRLRTLALERRARSAPDTETNPGPARDILAGAPVQTPDWRGSRGLLRAASSGAGDVAVLNTDDGCWTLHLVEDARGWRAILQLLPQAPFAQALLDGRAPLAVRDGAGATILEGRLDADGECEAAWPFALAPAAHLQAQGAAFSVVPLC